MQARQQEKLKQLESAVKALKKSGKGATVVIGSSASPSGDGDTVRLENCGNDVYARSDTTSCEFARNVQANYYSEIGSGSGVVNSYSPKTGTHYDMDCTAGRPHVCTGGDEAEVYFP